MFDLAGVLLDFGGVESVARLSAGRASVAAFDRFWSDSPWAEALYTGTCTPEALAAGAVEELRLDTTPGAFLREFQTWLRGPYPGAFELVGRLRPHAKVNEIGYRKPNADSYLHVLGAFGLTSSPGRALFLDDSTACVEGARQVGMQSYRVCGIREISSRLAALGIPLSDAPEPDA